MVSDMVGMSMRDECSRPLIPRIQPQVEGRQIDTAFVTESDHPDVHYIAHHIPAIQPTGSIVATDENASPIESHGRARLPTTPNSSAKTDAGEGFVGQARRAESIWGRQLSLSRSGTKLQIDTPGFEQFDESNMKRLLLAGLVAPLATIAWTRAENPLPIPQAKVLPLVLNDDFQFRKFDIFRNVLVRPGATPQPTRELAIQFERKRRMWGAIDGFDARQHTGQYFTFFWKAKRPANLTLRMEYRQANLKNYVQARELYYPSARGNHTSEFAIVGDDYSQDGPITSWRAVLIENDVIVALLQSRTWQ
jgi:hypothetical protein